MTTNQRKRIDEMEATKTKTNRLFGCICMYVPPQKRFNEEERSEHARTPPLVSHKTLCVN